MASGRALLLNVYLRNSFESLKEFISLRHFFFKTRSKFVIYWSDTSKTQDFFYLVWLEETFPILSFRSKVVFRHCGAS